MKKMLYLCLLAFIAACSGGDSTFEIDGFEIQMIPGSDAFIAISKNSAGKVFEKGMIKDGVKEGMWITYHENDRVKTISNYVGGKLNGTHFELNNRGQIVYKAEYLDEQFNGVVANFKFGRYAKQMHYNNGVLDGPFVEYSDRGKMQRKGSFKNGKQDGLLQYFDDDENLLMEYQYENGEKISGGILEDQSETEQ